MNFDQDKLKELYQKMAEMGYTPKPKLEGPPIYTGPAYVQMRPSHSIRELDPYLQIGKIKGDSLGQRGTHFSADTPDEKNPFKDENFYDKEVQWIECRNSSDVPEKFIGKLLVIQDPWNILSSISKHPRLAVLTEKVEYIDGNFFYFYDVVDITFMATSNLSSTATLKKPFKIRLASDAEVQRLKELFYSSIYDIYLGTKLIKGELPSSFPLKFSKMNRVIPL